MSPQRRAPVVTERPATRIRHGGSTSRTEDPASVVRAMAAKLGNTAMSARLAEATARRDALLHLVVARLRLLQSAQATERGLVRRREAWSRDVARGRPGWVLPDATRWHGAARAWREVARALARGELGRAAALLEEARSQERAALESAPAFLELPDGLREETGPPAAAEGVTDREGCPSRRLPAEVRIADRILAVTDRAGPVRTLRVPGHEGWWSEEPEEEKPAEPGGTPAPPGSPGRKRPRGPAGRRRPPPSTARRRALS